MSTAVKIKLDKTIVGPVAVFGSEPWAMSEMDIETLGSWERKISRKIYGPVVGQGIWRIRTREELRELYEDVRSSRY